MNKSIVLLITGIVLFLLWKKRKTMVKIWDDYWTNKRIETLHPLLRDRVKSFIQAAANKGIFLRVTSAKRSFSEQDDLYAQGRTKPGKVVTNAKGGESYHNYGLAFDVVPMMDGKPVWNDDELWQRVGRIGKSFGFTWGGDWVSFPDKPHFQDDFGLRLSELKNRYRGENEFVRLS